MIEPQPGSELTVRALVAGFAIGAVLAIGNIYMGLKTGWWDSGNITAAVVGFALVAPGARIARRPYSIFENNITQTVAGSAAVMPVVIGLLGALPALELLGHRYSPWALGAWGVGLAFFGILVAVPLRQRFVVSEPLPFPSAIATAEVIQAIHATEADARARTRALVAGAVAAMAFTWLRDGKPALIPGTAWLPVQVAGLSAESLTLGIGMSPMLAGVGMLVGARNGLSLLLGSGIAWGVLAPRLVRAGIAHADYASLVSWLLWPGVAMMVAAGLVSLAGSWRLLARAARDVRALRGQAGPRRGQAVLGLTATAVVVLAWLVFGVHPVLAAVSVLVSVALIDVCVRTAGETDIAPAGPLGQLIQLLLGLLSPGSGAVVNVACASVTAGAATHSALTVNVLKAGHILGAPPRPQVRAQMLGAVLGALVSLPAYALMRSAYGIGNAVLPAPGALGWKALAEVAEKGAASMPAWAGIACGVGALAGAALTLLDRTRAARFAPSPVALAVAFLVPAATAGAVALGVLLLLALRRRAPQATERFVSSAAAGGIAGESLMGVVIAVLLATGVLGAP